MTHGCRPVSATYHPANVATIPDGVMKTNIQRNHRDLKSVPRNRNHNEATPTANMSIAKQYIIRNAKNTSAILGWSSGGVFLRPSTRPLRLWVSQILPSTGVPNA